jgi:hypothetical protein
MVCDSFSRGAAEALFYYLEETNPDWEFDEVELSSQFSEYGDVCEAALDRGWEPEEGEDDNEKKAMRFLERDCIVVEFVNGGVIIGE